MSVHVRNSLVGLAIIFTLGCTSSQDSNHKVYIEIVDPVAKSKFIEVLEKKGREYFTDDHGRLAVKAESLEELDKDTQEYRDWYKKYYTTFNSGTD